MTILHHASGAVKSAHTPTIEEFLQSTPLQRGKYSRCPGCFEWAKVKSLKLYPAGTIDDNQSFSLCADCDRSMRHATEQVSVIVGNIGAYVGWADEVSK